MNKTAKTLFVLICWYWWSKTLSAPSFGSHWKQLIWGALIDLKFNFECRDPVKICIYRLPEKISYDLTSPLRKIEILSNFCFRSQPIWSSLLLAKIPITMLQSISKVTPALQIPAVTLTITSTTPRKITNNNLNMSKIVNKKAIPQIQRPSQNYLLLCLLAPPNPWIRKWRS